MTVLKITENFKTIPKQFSDKSLTQKAYLNALAKTLDFGARLITGFVVTPFLVAGLGSVGYGIWRTLDSLTGHMSVADGRPSQALKTTIVNLQSSTDYEEKRRNFASAILVWLLFFPLLTTVGGVLVWFAPIWVKGIGAAEPPNNPPLWSRTSTAAAPICPETVTPTATVPWKATSTVTI